MADGKNPSLRSKFFLFLIFWLNIINKHCCRTKINTFLLKELFSKSKCVIMRAFRRIFPSAIWGLVIFNFYSFFNFSLGNVAGFDLKRPPSSLLLARNIFLFHKQRPIWPLNWPLGLFDKMVLWFYRWFWEVFWNFKTDIHYHLKPPTTFISKISL